jgi:hypothetical protein
MHPLCLVGRGSRPNYPSGPAQITDWGADAGGNGAIAISIRVVPDGGDSAAAGSGDGVVSELRYRILGGAWVALDDPETYAVSEDEPDLLIVNVGTNVVINGGTLEIEYAQS